MGQPDQTNFAGPSKIKSIIVDGLFGYRDYVLPDPLDPNADVSDFFILYGDNGSGKTTILNLLFALLLPRHKAGSRTSIARTPFKRFVIEFDDATRISAVHPPDQLTGECTIRIEQVGQPLFEFKLPISEKGLVDISLEELEILLERIRALNLAVYFLPDDRRVTTSIFPDPEPEIVETRVESEAGRIVRRRERVERTHHLNLGPVLATVVEWARDRAFHGSSQGEQSATSIYEDVIDRIAYPDPYLPDTPESSDSLLRRIYSISKQTAEFNKFELVASVPVEKFLGAIRHANKNSLDTIAIVLRPYLDGLEARLSALEPLKRSISRFVETMNTFLTPKSITFDIRNGIRIYSTTGVELSPSVLSSGEKQLFLLLCNALLAADYATIFLIDEPEISLNVKWQRSLLDSLKGFAREHSVQFILATHSIELIAQHRGSAVRLWNRADAAEG